MELTSRADLHSWGKPSTASVVKDTSSDAHVQKHWVRILLPTHVPWLHMLVSQLALAEHMPSHMQTMLKRCADESITGDVSDRRADG
jgi:hypothetical protein